MSQTIKNFICVSLSIILLTGCSTMSGLFTSPDDEPPLEGERISVLDFKSSLRPDAPSDEDIKFALPEVWKNKFWPQAGGYPTHSMQHLSLNPNKLTQAWSVNIGKGSTKHIPLNGEPVVAGKRIFTLDTDFNLSAFNTEDGDLLWERSVENRDEDDRVISGGISYSKGALYVANGYRDLFAINPETGEDIWRVELPVPTRAAPTIMDGRIFISGLNNTLFALSMDDGQVLWTLAGMRETAGLLGAASPAANREVVIPAFSSGEVFAVHVENGSVAWSDNLSASRQTGGITRLADIRGMPVIDKDIVIAVSFGGEIVAIDARSGMRIWKRDIGGAETPWVAGDFVYMISSQNEVITLHRETGKILWVSQLPRYEKPGDIGSDPIFWAGPVLAGNRLIVVSSNGAMAFIDPESGNIQAIMEIGNGVRISPVVAGDTLYLLGENGILRAYR